jgi:PST family polysaccharide transporter
MTLGDVAARGAGTTLATQGVRAVLQLLSVVLLTRLLAPEDFGLIAMVTSVIGIAELLRDFGLSSAAVQARTVTPAQRNNLFWLNLVLGAGCAVLAAASTPLIRLLYDEPRLTGIVLALSCVFVLSGAATQFRADLTRRLRFRALALADIAAQTAGIVVALGAAIAGAGFWAIVAQQLTAAAASLALSAGLAGWLPGRPRRGVPLAKFLRFGRGLLGTQLVHYAVKNVDNIALGAYAGAVPLGLYSRAYQLLMAPLNMINAPMTRVALPVLSRVQDDDEVFARYLSKVQVVACLLTATVLAVAAGLAQPLVLLLFGERWIEVAPIFAVLAVGGVFRSVSQIGFWIYLARGVPGAQFRLSLAMGPVMVALMLAGLPWGPVGVAAGHSVGYLLMWVATLVHVGRAARVSTRPLFAQALRSMLLVSTPAGCAAWIGGQVSAPASVQVVAGTALAAAVVALLVSAVPALRRDATTALSFARRAVGR